MKKYIFSIGLCISFVIFLASCAASRTNFMKELNLKDLKDGTYTGKDSELICRVRVATTVKDGRITDVKILSHYVTHPFAGRAYDIIPKKIVEQQSLDVDAVTGATVSTDNIKKAVFSSLKSAGKR